MKRLLLTSFLTASALLLSACSADNTNNTPTSPSGAPQSSSSASSKKLMPTDPDLKSLYVQSCFSCHGTGAGGAPKTGSADWATRMEKGMDTLLDHTINGFQGMPPLGMCMDCGEEEFEALIRFMADPQ